MKKYRVGMYYTEVGYVTVEAEDKHEAVSKVYKHLEDNGLDELEVDCTVREYDAKTAEEMPNVTK